MQTLKGPAALNKNTFSERQSSSTVQTLRYRLPVKRNDCNNSVTSVTKKQGALETQYTC